jgi:hypothetical protein
LQVRTVLQHQPPDRISEKREKKILIRLSHAKSSCRAAGLSKGQTLIATHPTAARLLPCYPESNYGEKLKTLLHAFPGNIRIHPVIRLQDDWNIANGLLTPTLKLKRGVIENRYTETGKRLCKEHNIPS